MNKTIVYLLLLVTPLFTYGMDQLALVCTMEQKYRDLSSFASNSFNSYRQQMPALKSQEELPENLEDEYAYSTFLKKIDETREHPLILIPQIKPPVLEEYASWTRYLDLNRVDTFEVTSQGDIPTGTKYNFKQSVLALSRYPADIEKHLSESPINCYSQSLKTKKRKLEHF